MSVSFDRAAEYYDATRALPPEAMSAILAGLVERMRPAGRALELGAGTGRYAVPLRAGGVAVAGVDISNAMLRRLRQKDGSLPVALGDATSLPFRDGSFGSILAIHVLHLIPGWRTAIAEAARVLRPRGLLLVDPGDSERGNPVETKFFEIVGIEHRNPGLRSAAELEQEVLLNGGRAEPAIEVPAVHEISLAGYIDMLEAGMFSRCWKLDEAARREAAAGTRAWAQEALGDLHEPLRYERSVTIRVFRFS